MVLLISIKAYMKSNKRKREIAKKGKRKCDKASYKLSNLLTYSSFYKFPLSFILEKLENA